MRQGAAARLRVSRCAYLRSIGVDRTTSTESDVAGVLLLHSLKAVGFESAVSTVQGNADLSGAAAVLRGIRSAGVYGTLVYSLASTGGGGRVL